MIDTALRCLFFISILFLAYIAGVYSAVQELYVYRKIVEAGRYVEALGVLHKIKTEPFGSNLLYPTNHDKRGVSQSNPKEYYDGYNFIIHHSTMAQLTDMEGKVLHQWQLPLHEATGRLKNAQPYIHWHQAYPLENGDLIAVYENAAGGIYGAGMVKMNQHSVPIWSLDNHFHHNLSIDEKGNIYSLEHVIEKHEIYGFNDIRPPYWDEFVTVISNDGQVIKRVSLFKALKNSQYKDSITIINSAEGDYIHSNKAEYLDKQQASKLPFAKEGNILLSLRNLDAIAILDIENEKITWMLQGAFSRQHDPDVLHNGNIMIFDNQGLHKEKNIHQSRIIELNPVNNKIVWQYNGDGTEKFFSNIRGSQQLLPNDNLLITESSAGRVFEINRKSGEIVWEYHSPYIKESKHQKFRGILVKARRFDKDYFKFMEHQ